MGRPKAALSVLIPTRNRAAYVSSCLESLASQRNANDAEFVVIDNASNDGTDEVLHAWSRRDPRLVSLFEPRLGRSRALNTGILAASWDFLLFTDDDVLIQQGWVDALRRFLSGRQDELVLAGGPIRPLPADLGSWPTWLGPDTMNDLFGLQHGDRQRQLDSSEPLWGANMAAPAALFRRLGGWEESLGRQGDHRGTYEDIEMQSRLRAHGGSVWYLPQAVIMHRTPRSFAAPRRVLYGAFHAGLSTATATVHKHGLSRRDTLERVVPALVWHGAHWGSLALLLHVRRDRRTFRSARTAAARVGRDLGIVDALADHRRRNRALRRLARRAAFGLLTRLAPAR